MTQEEKDQFIRFNSLLEEIKDIDSSIDTMKVRSVELLSPCRARFSNSTMQTMKACLQRTRRVT